MHGGPRISIGASVRPPIVDAVEVSVNGCADVRGRFLSEWVQVVPRVVYGSCPPQCVSNMHLIQIGNPGLCGPNSKNAFGPSAHRAGAD